MFIKKYKIAGKVYEMIYADEQQYLDEQDMIKSYLDSYEYKKSQLKLWYGEKVSNSYTEEMHKEGSKVRIDFNIDEYNDRED